jgi:predicted dinucleotide-binding enzyme
MQIAVIGAGKVGTPLGQRAGAAGYRVAFGVRDPDAAGSALLAPAVSVATPRAAAVGAEIVLLTVPASAALQAARDLALAPGTVLVDCTNPLRWDNGPVWTPPAEGSMAATLATALPGVRVVKGFNHFGAEIHANPEVGGRRADAFFAGDDRAAVRQVMQLAEAIGFHAADAGPLRNAAVLENIAVLWIQLAQSGAGREFAFCMLGR